MGILSGDITYKRNPEKLLELLREFACGQVHERTRFGEVFQGSFTNVTARLYNSTCMVSIKFFWFCKLRVVTSLSELHEPTIVGDKLDIRDDWELRVPFVKFCHQVGKKRIKVFGDDGEIIYFTRRENPINLNMDDYGRFIGPSIRTYISQLTLPGAFKINH